MEEKDEFQQSHLPSSEENIKEKPDNSMETNPTVETNQTLMSNEQNHLLEEAKEAEAVSDAEKVGETKEEKQAISLSQKGKAKAGGKQRKAKPTIPQPFSLATERRMSSRQKRGGVDFDHPILKSTSSNYKCHAQTSQKVERSAQLRHGTAAKTTSLRCLPTDKPTENQQEEKELEIKRPRKSPTLRASPLPILDKEASQKPQLKKIPLTCPKSPLLHQGNRSISESLHRQSKSISEFSNNKKEAFKRSRSISKVRNNKMEAITENSSKTTGENTILSESITTKPEVIHRRSKSISELSSNKMEAFKRTKSTRESGNSKMEPIAKKDFETPSVHATSSESRAMKPEAVHQRSKSISELGNNKMKVFNRSKPISKTENNKMGGVIKNGSKPEAVHKSTSRTISSSAKEAINRFLRGSWKGSNKQCRESVKGGKSCGVGLGKEEVISSNGGKALALSG